ncbi:MAG TPA: helix-turn-helix domain-containing protein [Solirubrobacterales bacterium]|nr:helix-turn-helix domain-containing protein [Solirubrobacterales bacterium]
MTKIVSEWDRTLREIRKAAKRRAKADEDRRKATDDLKTNIRAARSAGIPITQIASEAGLSRQAVYDVLEARPSS